MEWMDLMRRASFPMPGSFATQVGQPFCFVAPLTIDGNRKVYCFTFVQINDRWYFRHFESILIRLDQLGPLPVTVFPDISEPQKSWVHAELETTEQIRFFNLLAAEKRKPFAFDWFKDGAGYLLAAKTWVPLVPASQAFIPYLCWEQANLRGNPTRLEKLTETDAIVKIEPAYFKLYDQTAHLRQQISLPDYQQLFQTIWRDRAEQAGWVLQLDCTDAQCLFRFRRPEPAS